jgi:hypothetical protein
MPIARFQMPDGRIGRFEVPEGVTPEQAQSMIEAQVGKMEPTKPDYDEALDAGSTLKVGPWDTGIGIGPKTNQFLAGMGKRFSDIGTLGARDEPASDKALMERGWAQVGSAGADLATMAAGGMALRGVGEAAALAPRVGQAINTAGRALYAPQTLKQAATAGAVYNAATTNGDAEERAKSGGLGAAAGTLGTVVGRGVHALSTGGKALIEPFTQAGQENIAGRTLQRFAVDPSRLDGVGSYASAVPGVRPTLAEAALDPGISNLQRQFAVNLADQQMQNNAARVAAVRSAGGSDTTIAAAKKARDDATNSLYETAKKAVVQGDNVLDDLLQRPSMQAAAAQAAMLAAERNGATGLTVGHHGYGLPKSTPAKTVQTGVLDAAGNPIVTTIPGQPAKLSGQMLHELKLGLDDALNKGGDTGIQGNAKRYAMDTKGDYLSWLENKIPEYGQARQTFASMSKPINSMELGNEILKRSSSPAEDALGNPTLFNNAFSRTMRDGDAVAQKVTGFNKATLASTMEPQSLNSLRTVRKDLARKTAADNLGKANGSPTAQNLAAQNIMRQIAGPLGMPSGFAEANIWPTMLRPINWAMKAQDPKVEAVLIRALQDPQFAAGLLSRPAARQALPSRGLGLLGPVAVSAHVGQE